MLKDKKVAYSLLFLLMLLLVLQLAQLARGVGEEYIEYRYDELHEVGIFTYKTRKGVALQVIPEALLANPERIE